MLPGADLAAYYVHDACDLRRPVVNLGGWVDGLLLGVCGGGCVPSEVGEDGIWGGGGLMSYHLRSEFPRFADAMILMLSFRHCCVNGSFRHQDV